jgi:site-specific recombinase XerD
VTVHDLRHSFAVHMLVDHNQSVKRIARLLGNSESVCEKYYLNFVFEDDTLDSLVAQLKR